MSETMGAVTKAKAPEPEDAPSPELLAEIERLKAALADEIDIDGLLEQRDVDYRVRNLEGEDLTFTLPGDLPLPVSMGLLRAWDRWARAQYQVVQTGAVVEQAETEKAVQKALKANEAAIDGIPKAWDRLLEALLRAVRIHQPATALEDLRDGFGQTVIEHWLGAVVTRLHAVRFALGYAQVASPKEGRAKPATKRRRRKR